MLHRSFCNLLKIVSSSYGMNKEEMELIYVSAMNNTNTRANYMFSRNYGKIFQLSTIPFDYWVNFSTMVICEVMYNHAVLTEKMGIDNYLKQLFYILTFYEAKILPRYYQDAVYVRYKLILSTYNLTYISCDFTDVVDFVMSMKGGVYTGFGGVHKKLYCYNVGEYALHQEKVNAHVSGDFTKLAVTCQLFSFDSELLNICYEKIYAPDGIWFNNIKEKYKNEFSPLPGPSSYQLLLT